MRIGLFRSEQKAISTKIVRQAMDCIVRHGGTVLLENTVSDLLQDGHTGFAREEILQNIDIAMVFGGDGSMLGMARQTAGKDIPLLGVNLGKLGYLASVEADDMADGIGRLFEGRYTLRKRMLLQASVPGMRELALNDVILRPTTVMRMARIDVSVDGQPYARFDCDGMLASSPTGATAYSFSLGGPIVSPELECLILAPIFAHNGRSRHLMLDAGQRIDMTPVSNEEEMQLWLDGQRQIVLPPGTTVSITRASEYAQFISFQENNFYSVLRNRLNDW